MLKPDDIIEATEDLLTDDGPISAGMRLVVGQVSVSGGFIQPMWYSSYLRSSAFKKVGEWRRVEPGGVAPAVFVAVPA